MNRKDFQELSRIRLGEARALLRLGHFDGAFYLAGYSVECALKACIAKATRRHDFPDKKRAERSYTHSLPDLLRAADLELSRTTRADADRQFKDNWEVVLRWSEQSRYLRKSADEAKALIAAIEERHYGVMTWIRLHW